MESPLREIGRLDPELRRAHVAEHELSKGPERASLQVEGAWALEAEPAPGRAQGPQGPLRGSAVLPSGDNLRLSTSGQNGLYFTAGIGIIRRLAKKRSASRPRPMSVKDVIP